jgi:adenylate cyclase
VLGGFMGVNFWLFWSMRISLLMAAPLAAAATSFAAGNLGRYVTEGREKRRYASTLIRYVAPSIVEAMMKDRRLTELSNEKRDLTVLFSDIRGFTSLSEKVSVDVLVKTLNEFLNAMVTVIFDNGGTLDKFVGDCVMAFWGAPIPQPNHAELAARSALEMQAALERLNQKWRAQGRPELRIGVGINTGEMILGNIGSQQRMDFTVIGDNVNLASRLESSTKELKASIVISDATYQRIKHLAEVRDLGTIHVKGKDVGIRVYELLGMGREESPSYAGAQG